MNLKADKLADELLQPYNPEDPFIITPKPDLNKLKKAGSASIDFRLGTWFLKPRASQIGLLDIYGRPRNVPNEVKLAKSYYVPFGGEFILHPRSFVLGVTLEWIRLPANWTAYVIGKSSWGRYGLIIATATGVHPGFTGCLTLELSNIGEIPIRVRPGTRICQIFIQEVKSNDLKSVDRTSFIGRRKPTLGAIKLDKIAKALAEELQKLGAFFLHNP